MYTQWTWLHITICRNYLSIAKGLQCQSNKCMSIVCLVCLCSSSTHNQLLAWQVVCWYIVSYQVCLHHPVITHPLPHLHWNTSHGENITYMYQLKALQTAASGGGDVVVVNLSTTYHSTFVQTKQCTEHGVCGREVTPAVASNYSNPIITILPDGDIIQ